MLEAISSELVVELREAFPHLVIGLDLSAPYSLVVEFDEINCMMVWLNAETIMASARKKKSWETIVCYYGDPEVFDRIQSFISAQYEAYLSEAYLSDKETLK